VKLFYDWRPGGAGDSLTLSGRIKSVDNCSRRNGADPLGLENVVRTGIYPVSRLCSTFPLYGNMMDDM
jgi:hypothetical protein